MRRRWKGWDGWGFVKDIMGSQKQRRKGCHPSVAIAAPELCWKSEFKGLEWTLSMIIKKCTLELLCFNTLTLTPFHHRPWLPHHTKQRNPPLLLSPIPTFHLLNQPKPKLLIDPHIRISPTTLQITRHPLSIRHAQNLLHQRPPHSLSLPLRQHSNDIAEIISLWISPDLGLGVGLSGFPYPVSFCGEAAPTVSQVHEELGEGESVGGEVVGPGLGGRRGGGRHPHCAAEDFGRRGVPGYV